MSALIDHAKAWRAFGEALLGQANLLSKTNALTPDTAKILFTIAVAAEGAAQKLEDMIEGKAR